MTRTQELKQPIRAFMRAHYTDERLAELLAHAQDGKLAYNSCCCFIGITTATHALQGKRHGDYWSAGNDTEHIEKARTKSGANNAEQSFNEFGYLNGFMDVDGIRIRILIPMIRAEMKRRAAVRALEAQAPVTEAVQV